MRAQALQSELVGRERELGLVDRWTGLLPSGPAGLLVTGEPGIGKTSVWAAAVEAAGRAGARCLVTRPVESELPLAYAGLADLLGDVAAPLLAGLDEVPARGVAAALLLDDEPAAAEPLAVARGTLGVLSALAAQSPVVLAIDDVQWLDPASARALAFALRRLDDAPIGVVASLRDGHRDPLELVKAFGDRAVEARLEGLTVGAIGRVLRARGEAALARRVVVLLHERSGGNPFYALELVRAGAYEGLPPSLRDVVEGRLAAAPAEAAPAVELAAVLAPAPIAAFDDPAALDAAYEAGLLVELDDHVRFSHPLLAAGAYQRLPPGRRRALHLQASERAATVEEQARHLALATTGEDAAAAELLEHAARAARERGAPEFAAELAGHARRLTPDGDKAARSRRTMDEAEYLFLAADETAARERVDEVLAAGISGETRARALVQRSMYDVDPVEAVGRLEEAAREPHDDERLRARTLSQLAWQRGCWAGDVTRAAPEALAAVELAEQVGDEATLASALTTAGLVCSLAGMPEADEFFRRAVEIADRVQLEAGDRAPRSAYAHDRSWRGHWAAAEALLEHEREDAERVGDEWLLMRLRLFRCDLELRRGAWAGAEVLLDAALDELREYWYVVALTRRAILRGRRGEQTALEDALEIAATPLAAGDPVIAATAEHAVGLLELAEGRAVSAAGELVALTDLVAGAGARAPEIEASIPDTVLALVEAGRNGEADSLTRHLEHRARRPDDPWANGAAGLCRGIVLLGADDVEGALERLAAAKATLEEIGAPWELAHTLLAEGHALRRVGRRTDAAGTLTRAAELFDELGAAPWRERAAAELRRARPRPRRDDTLTAAESRVAVLVAGGGTNKEVAAQLFTTVATVEAHLTRIYRKLGLRSRSELARAVADGEVSLDA